VTAGSFPVAEIELEELMSMVSKCNGSLTRQFPIAAGDKVTVEFGAVGEARVGDGGVRSLTFALLTNG
jgi:hypothetical protein